MGLRVAGCGCAVPGHVMACWSFPTSTGGPCAETLLMVVLDGRRALEHGGEGGEIAVGAVTVWAVALACEGDCSNVAKSRVSMRGMAQVAESRFALRDPAKQ